MDCALIESGPIGNLAFAAAAGEVNYSCTLYLQAEAS